MSDENKPDKHAQSEPKPGIGDLVHTGAKAAIPIAGAVIGGAIGGPTGAAIGAGSGVVAEFFGTIVDAPLSKLRTKWFNSLYEDLNALAQRVDGLTPEALSENKTFLSTLL